MKKDVDDNITKKFKKRPKNIQLMKKIDTKDNSKIFGSTFSNNFTSINKVTNHLLNQKKITAKQPHKFNLTNESTSISVGSLFLSCFSTLFKYPDK